MCEKKNYLELFGSMFLRLIIVLNDYLYLLIF